jgi:hypothetical protein
MKKIISIVAIFLLIINFNLVQNVHADENPSGFIKLDDFDSYLIDDRSGCTEGFCWETVEGSDGLIVGNAEPGGDKYLLFGYKGTVATHSLNADGETIWFNSTYSHTGYYTKHIHENPHECICYYDFVNDAGDDVVRLKVGKAGHYYDNQFYYYNSNSWKTIGANANTKYMSWNYYTDNVIQYSIYDGNFDLQNVINDTACNTSLTDRTDYEVSDCKIHATGSGSVDKYHIIHEYGYMGEELEYEQEGEGEIDEDDQYLSFGTCECDDAVTWDRLYKDGDQYKNFEIQRDIPMNCIIKEFHLPILYDDASSDYDYLKDVGKNSIYLTINNQSVGNPDIVESEWCQNEFTNDKFYLLKWKDMSITLNNIKPLFEIEMRDSEYDNAVITFYGQCGTCEYDGWNVDYDSDSKIGFRCHDSSDSIDGVYNGDIWYKSGWENEDTGKMDLLYECFYIAESGDKSPSGDYYSDSLTLNYDSIGLHETQTIRYTSNISEGDTYLYIYNSTDSLIINETCSNYGKVSLNPTIEGLTDTGTYDVTLNRGGSNITTDSFIVTDDSGLDGVNYQIYLSQNVFTPSQFNDDYIYYKYNKTYAGNDGYIQLLDKSGNELYSWYVDDTDWSQHTIGGLPSLENGEYVLRLGSISSGTIYNKDSFDFIIQSSEGAISQLSISDNEIEIGEKITISGYHDLVGFNVYVKVMPTNERFYIADEPNFNFQYEPQDTGDYYFYLYHNDESLTSPKALYVSDIVVERNPILPSISQPLGSIIGLLITMFTLLTPFFLVTLLNDKTKMKLDIPPVVYAFTGGLGIAISTILNLFPNFVPFFIIAVGIIALVGAYLIGQKNVGGGD